MLEDSSTSYFDDRLLDGSVRAIAAFARSEAQKIAAFERAALLDELNSSAAHDAVDVVLHDLKSEFVAEKIFAYAVYVAPTDEALLIVLTDFKQRAFDASVDVIPLELVKAAHWSSNGGKTEGNGKYSN